MKSGKMILLKDDFNKLHSIHLYIQEHLCNDLSIETLASQFNSSPSKLKRQFRHLYEKSIRSYILECRMQRAKKLILENSCSISEVASLVGYKNRTSFTHAFCSFFGTSPFQLMMRQINQQDLN